MIIVLKRAQEQSTLHFMDHKLNPQDFTLKVTNLPKMEEYALKEILYEKFSVDKKFKEHKILQSFKQLIPLNAINDPQN